MEYTVCFTKQIHGCFASFSSSDRMVCKRTTIPFAPFIGLETCVGDRDDDDSHVIDNIYWDRRRKEFVVRVDADKEFYERGLTKSELRHATKEEMDEKVKDYEQDGWQIFTWSD